MSYLIKERMMMDKSDQGDSVTSADSAVTIENNFARKTEGRIEQASFEVKRENVEVAGYPHFPADNITEVWLNIFEKLDSEDKITFSRACQEWHDWVAIKRTCFHFSEVVPVMLEQTDLPEKELLRFRTMCKSWTHDFNRVYQAHPSHLLLETEKDGVEENQIIKLDNHFTSSKQIQRFLEEMHSHHGNPFPGRSIILTFYFPYKAIQTTRADRLRLVREYYEKAIELLEMHGLHLHMAMFELGHGSSLELEPMETYNYFRRWLFHVPNLKKLVVAGHNNCPFLDEEQMFYRQNTLPQLPYLELVSIYKMSHAIWNGVLESSCVPLKVKRLLLDPPTRMERLRTPEAAHFPNLEAFEVRLSGEYLERFLNVLEGTLIPPVVTAAFHYCEDYQDFGRVFRGLEVFAGSLAFLKLCLRFTEMSSRNAIVSGFAINLPQLKRLDLLHFNGPLDPFCQLPSLKYLTVEWFQLREWVGSKVDIYGFEGRMEESNIWDMISSLQQFHLQSFRPPVVCKTYHRDMLQLSMDVLELDC